MTPISSLVFFELYTCTPVFPHIPSDSGILRIHMTRTQHRSILSRDGVVSLTDHFGDMTRDYVLFRPFLSLPVFQFALSFTLNQVFGLRTPACDHVAAQIHRLAFTLVGDFAIVAKIDALMLEEIDYAPLPEIPRLVMEKEEEEEEKECAVCLEALSEGDEVAKLVCSHMFHYGCVLTWLHRNPSCPVCRCEIQHMRAASLRFC